LTGVRLRARDGLLCCRNGRKHHAEREPMIIPTPREDSHERSAAPDGDLRHTSGM